MMSSAGLGQEWDQYVLVLREDAHQLLAWSYADSRAKLTQAKDEYEITGLLAEGIDARINSLQTPERFMFYAVHNEKPTSPVGQLGKHRPRLDIQIERCGVRPKAYFTFEAKRLRDDATSNVSKTMQQYLGDDGILRFIRGYYAPESSEAAMLGCIQAHEAGYWYIQLSNAFDVDGKDGDPLLALTEPLRPIFVIPEFPDERHSVHERTSGGDIRIFHLFINCRQTNE